jgi:hypothetical protein
MRALFAISLLAASMFACGHTKTKSGTHGEVSKEEAKTVQLPDRDATGAFGAAISAPEKAIHSSELPSKLTGNDSVRVTVKGQISSCCLNKGCWMKMPLGDGSEMTVKFKNYGFFVPRNSAGKTAIIEGWAYREMVSVGELRHFAEDAGKSKEEIEKITQPQERITFLADGAIVEPAEN